MPRRGPLICTIASANYLPQAAFMAASIAANYPGARVALCLLEHRIDEQWRPLLRTFDRVLLARELPIENFEHLMFRHSILEASTAIKPTLLRHLLLTHSDVPAVIYLDPDTWVFSVFEEVEPLLETGCIVVTPHHVEDEETSAGVNDNMLRTLHCGVFNLGFLALGRSSLTDSFLDWWERKLVDYCVVDFARGLFVDQKWVDVAISFFDLCVLRHSGYNVANWNISHRDLQRVGGAYWVNGTHKLRFLHFSGIGTGRDRRVFLKWASADNEIHWLREQYKQGIVALDVHSLSHRQWDYARYKSGEPVSDDARLAARRNPSILDALVSPFEKSNEFFLQIGW